MDDNRQLHGRAFANTGKSVKGDLYFSILLRRVVIHVSHTHEYFLAAVTRCEFVVAIEAHALCTAVVHLRSREAFEWSPAWSGPRDSRGVCWCNLSGSSKGRSG
jgi:hypothetical protein